MPSALFITPFENGQVVIPSEELTYQDGEVDVMRDTLVETDSPESYEPPEGATVIGDPLPIEWDEEDNPILWQLRVRALETVPKMVGGWAVASEAPPDLPPGTVLAVIRATEAALNDLDTELQNIDDSLGMITEIDDDE